MPNYVKHILTINAEGQKLNQILDAIKGEDRVIDFNKIIPMPESLNVESGSRGDEAVKYIQSRMKGVKEQTVLDRENISIRAATSISSPRRWMRTYGSWSS